MKSITCGIIAIINNKMLVCHSTNSPWNTWNFPKGIAEPNESYSIAAIRELREETGIILLEEALEHSFGVHPYIKGKDMILFSATIEPHLFDPKKLGCSSMVYREGKEPFPEVDAYQLIDVNPDCLQYFSKNMQKYMLNYILPILIK